MTTLQALLAIDLAKADVPLGTVEAQLAALRRTQAVLAVREAFEAGSISTSEIEQFVRGLFESFKAGERFQWDDVLSAIAVALGPVADQFCQSFLTKLASIKARELSMSRVVAERVLRDRKTLSPLTWKKFAGGATTDLGSHVVQYYGLFTEASLSAYLAVLQKAPNVAHGVWTDTASRNWPASDQTDRAVA